MIKIKIVWIFEISRADAQRGKNAVRRDAERERKPKKKKRVRARERERADAEPLCSCCLVKPSALTASFLVLHFIAESAYRVSFSVSLFLGRGRVSRGGKKKKKQRRVHCGRESIRLNIHTCLPCRATRFRRKRPLDRSAPHRCRRVRLRRRAIAPSTSRCPQQSPSRVLRPPRRRIPARR